jgi:hypothetical protein
MPEQQNRILAHRDAIQRLVASKGWTPEEETAKGRALDITFEEWISMTDTQAVAFAGGWITADEANTLHDWLKSVDHFNHLSYAQKATATKCFAELLTMKIRSGSTTPTTNNPQ